MLHVFTKMLQVLLVGVLALKNSYLANDIFQRVRQGVQPFLSLVIN